MQTPTLLFSDDFSQLLSDFKNLPHQTVTLKKGEPLWKAGQPYHQIFYIQDGVVQNAIEHEEGFRKILSFHGQGTVFPAYHEKQYKIEDAIILTAMTDVTAMVFSVEDFAQLYYQNQDLQRATINWFSTYVNLLLYDAAHQTYNSSLMKLANLLFLLHKANQKQLISPTQEELANMLGISRVNISRHLAQLRTEGIIRISRQHIDIIDEEKLTLYCSLETV